MLLAVGDEDLIYIGPMYSIVKLDFFDAGDLGSAVVFEGDGLSPKKSLKPQSSEETSAQRRKKIMSFIFLIILTLKSSDFQGTLLRF